MLFVKGDPDILLEEIDEDDDVDDDDDDDDDEATDAAELASADAALTLLVISVALKSKMLSVAAPEISPKHISNKI